MREAARLLGAALLAAFMLVQSAAAQTVAPPLEVGIGTREADALGYFAQDLGFFKKVGLDVELQQFSAGPQIAAAIASGHLQIGDSNVISLANSRARGLPFVYICGMNIYSAAHPTALAVVAENSPIKTAKELNGRTVAGVSLASIDQTNMFAWIDKNGGDWQSVKFIGNGWIASEEWADAHVETVKKFREAIAMAAVWANAHPDAAAKIFNRYAKTQISRLHARYTSAPLDAKIVQPILDAAAKYKILPRQMSASEILWSHQ